MADLCIFVLSQVPRWNGRSADRLKELLNVRTWPLCRGPNSRQLQFDFAEKLPVKEQRDSEIRLMTDGSTLADSVSGAD
jgi:hypothetical protein